MTCQTLSSGLALIDAAGDAVRVSLAESVLAIPSRLRDLAADSSGGAMRQPAVSVRSGRWIDALGGYASMLEQFRGEVDRVNGRALPWRVLSRGRGRSLASSRRRFGVRNQRAMARSGSRASAGVSRPAGDSA